MSISFFNQTLRVFSQIKDKKHIEQNFHSVAGIMLQGWDLGVLGVKNLSVGICDGTPSTARYSLFVMIGWFGIGCHRNISVFILCDCNT